MPAILANPPYHRRAIPAKYDNGWLGLELSNVQRGIPSIRIRRVVADDTPTALDHTLIVDATAAPVSIALPAADQAQGLYLVIKRINTGANAVTIVGTVDGVVNPTLSAVYQSYTVQSDGVAYHLLAQI